MCGVIIDTANAQEQKQVQTGIVLLKDGRVFPGSYQQVPGGYRVENHGGSVILPFEQVHLTAESLVNAYEIMRDATLQPSTDQHLKLAEWCINNDLLEQARVEITWALQLEPLRTEARLLLAQLDAKSNLPVVKHPKPAMSADGFRLPDERTDSGIFKEAHQEFIRKVQPILVNKCGNAGCHGSAATNNFLISNARRTAQGTIASDQNLEAVLSFIDPNSPDSSPLLLKPSEQTPHHKKQFLGAAGRLQYQTLSQWVNDVSTSMEKPKPRIDPQLTTLTPQPRNAMTEEPAAPIQQVNGIEASPAREKALLQEIRNAQEPDAFDPEVFNRKMHGAKRN